MKDIILREDDKIPQKCINCPYVTSVNYVSLCFFNKQRIAEDSILPDCPIQSINNCGLFKVNLALKLACNDIYKINKWMFGEEYLDNWPANPEYYLQQADIKIHNDEILPKDEEQ